MGNAGRVPLRVFHTADPGTMGAPIAVGRDRRGVAPLASTTVPPGDAPLIRVLPLRLVAALVGALLALPGRSLAVPSGTQAAGQGAEGPQARALEPPPAVAPPLLEARVPGDRRRAEQELQDAAVLDALAIRALRAVDEQHAQAAPPCPQLLAGQRGAEMARDEAAQRVQTSGALLQGAGARDELDERHAALQARIVGLDERIAAVQERLRRRCPAADLVAPRLWLPSEARVPADERVVIFVSAGAASQVVWVDGQPSAASGPDGWAVAVTRPGPVALCVAPPAAATCRALSEVYAAMGAAFELALSP